MRIRVALLAIVLLAARLAFVAASQNDDDPATLRMIVVSAADEAERLIARLEQGADFAALARAESIDPTAAAGGLLGSVRRSELRPELRDALNGVKPGRVTHVVKLPTGFAVVKVEAVSGSAVGAPGVGASPVVAATGAVKYTLDVGGLPEAEAVLRELEKPVAWDQDPRTICDVRRASMADAQRTFEQFFRPEMSAIRETRQPFEVMQAHLGLAQLHAYQGALDLAIPHYEQAYQLARASVSTAVPQIEEMLGVTYLHHAGIDNDAYRAPGELCLIPPRPGVSYAKTADAERAIHHFVSYLQQKPADLEVRWLLNLAHMAAGTYPGGVPSSFLIPPARFASAEDVGRFTDVAPQAGLDVFSTAGGVIVDDLGGSGRFDVVTSNFYSCR